MQILKLLCIAVLAAQAMFAGAQESLRIGSSMPLTGPAAESGKLLMAGATLYFDRVNAQGGVNGKKLQFEVLDDGYDPAKAVENVQKLLKDRKVVALFSNVGTAQVAASLPVVQESKVPLFSPVTGAPALRRQHIPQVFHVRASYRDELQRIIDHAKTMGVSRLALAYTADPAGEVVLNEIKDLLLKSDVQLVAVAGVAPRDSDFGAAAREVMAAKPQAVIIGSVGTHFTKLLAECKAMNAGALQFYGLSVVDPRLVASELGAAARGLVLAQIMPSVRNTAIPVVREYLDALSKARPGAQPAVLELDAYVSAKIFVEGLKRAGRDPSPELVVAAFDNMGRFDAGGFAATFSRDNHAGAGFVDLAIVGNDGKLLY